MDLKFVIIGCGRIGRRHAGHVVNNGDLVAVCDINRQAAEDLSL